jgi:pyruvate formate lyase activating enzyme
MELEKEPTAKVFDIQGFSVHDGPGARSLIFLKGCPLNCLWCCNPEGISLSKIPLYYASKCIGCGNCTTSCVNNAIHQENGKPEIDRDICIKCNAHSCADNCYTEALQICGRNITVSELFSIIQRDRQFWGNNGGITFTGGEPFLQADFVCSILKKCYNANIYTAVETCGYVPWVNFEKSIDYLDWIFFDLKHIDPVQHITGTGQGNSIIINNISKLNDSFRGRLVFRMPLIPGFNNDENNLEGIAGLISGTKWKEINILPLHHLGREKFRLIGKEYKGLCYNTPSSKELANTKAIFEKYNIECFIGHDTLY